jgi:hypothetical protein
MSDDRERLEHYLEWQRAWDRARAARRRRWRRGAAAALAVVGASGGAWLAGLPRTGGGVATDTRPPGPDVDGAAAAGSEGSVAARRAPSPVGDVAARRPARGTLGDPASRRARPPVEARVTPMPAPSPPPTPAPSAEGEQDSAVAAAIATAPHPVSPTEAPAAEPAPAEAAPPIQAPPAEPVTPTSPAEALPPLPTSATGPVPPAVTSPRVSDRVTGWLRGELQELRDGVTREIDDARVGYRTMRRGVEQLRSRLRGH